MKEKRRKMRRGIRKWNLAFVLYSIVEPLRGKMKVVNQNGAVCLSDRQINLKLFC